MATSVEEMVKTFKSEAPVTEAQAKPEAPKVTKEELRGAMAKKAAGGYKKEVIQLMKDMGYKKLSEIPESQYATLLKEVEDL